MQVTRAADCGLLAPGSGDLGHSLSSFGRPLRTRASGEVTFRDLSGEQAPLGLNINCIYPTRTCPQKCGHLIVFIVTF